MKYSAFILQAITARTKPRCAMLRFAIIVGVLVGLPAPLLAGMEEALLKTPEWESNADNPPLSARTAIDLATQKQKTLVKDSKGRKWGFFTADLHYDSSVDRWFWVVIFVTDSRPDDPGFIDGLYVVVLMDGKVGKPVMGPFFR